MSMIRAELAVDVFVQPVKFSKAMFDTYSVVSEDTRNRVDRPMLTSMFEVPEKLPLFPLLCVMAAARLAP